MRAARTGAALAALAALCAAAEREAAQDTQVVRMRIAYTKGAREEAAEVRLALFARQYPRTTENFKRFCTGITRSIGGAERVFSYEGVPFHRIVAGFVVQGGDVLHRNGTGALSAINDDGSVFENEADQAQGAAPALGERRHDAEGMLAMANRGRDTNGSQFYITLGPRTQAERAHFSHLDASHTVFGKVISGMEKIREIADEHEAEARQGRAYFPAISKMTVTEDAATEEELQRYAIRGPEEKENTSDTVGQKEWERREL